MQNNIQGLIKPVKKNGKVLTHQDTSKEGVTEYRCSTFIKKKNVLVKGEYENKHKDKRNAIIVLIDSDSGNIVGKSRLKNAQ